MLRLAKSGFAALALLFVPTLGHAQTVIDGSDKNVPEVVMREMMRQLQDVLRDPDAAKIKQIYQLNGNGPIWCGEINAPNGYGGMSGYDTFIINMKVRMVHVANPLEPNDIFRNACRAGHS